MTTSGPRILTPVVLTLLGQFLFGPNAATSGLEEAGQNEESGFSQRINTGVPLEPFHFRFVVRISYLEYSLDTASSGSEPYRRQGYCSGVLLSPAWVLTAARCLPCHYLYKLVHKTDRFVKYNTSESLQVSEDCSDEADKSTGPCKMRDVEEYFAHENSVTFMNECSDPTLRIVMDLGIALLKIKAEDEIVLVGGGYATLLKGSMPFDLTPDCTAVGFGMQHEDESGVIAWDYRQHFIKMPLGRGKMFCCNSKGSIVEKEDRICAYNLINGANMPCEGDQGGPLVCAGGSPVRPDLPRINITVGIFPGDVERVRCGQIRKFWLNYTSTEAIRDWITNTTGIDSNIFQTFPQ